MWDRYVRRKQTEESSRFYPVERVTIEGQRAKYWMRDEEDDSENARPTLAEPETQASSNSDDESAAQGKPSGWPDDVEPLRAAASRLDVGSQRLTRLLVQGRIKGAYRILVASAKSPQWAVPKDAVLPAKAAKKKPAAPNRQKQVANVEADNLALKAEVKGLNNLLTEKDARIADLKQLLDFATRRAIDQPAVGYIRESPAKDQPGDQAKATGDTAQSADQAKATDDTTQWADKPFAEPEPAAEEESLDRPVPTSAELRSKLDELAKLTDSLMKPVGAAQPSRAAGTAAEVPPQPSEPTGETAAAPSPPSKSVQWKAEAPAGAPLAKPPRPAPPADTASPVPSRPTPPATNNPASSPSRGGERRRAPRSRFGTWLQGFRPR